MDPVEKVNNGVAGLLGWKQRSGGWLRENQLGSIESVAVLPQYTESFIDCWELVEFAARHRTEFSLFMLLYDRTPMYMASFMRGLEQRTSTGDCPKLATCKAFLMMFTPEDQQEDLLRRH